MLNLQSVNEGTDRIMGSGVVKSSERMCVIHPLLSLILELSISSKGLVLRSRKL